MSTTLILYADLIIPSANLRFRRNAALNTGPGMRGRYIRIPSKVFLKVALLAGPLVAHTDDGLRAFSVQTFIATCSKNDRPAAATLAQIDGRIAVEAAGGVCAQGRREPVTIDGRWYIGSNAKALTATMIARLVEQGVMQF
ncbi:serine hydrolase [Microbulbifer sp. TYP-18]|uniref:serine hydrolase n=1 Tax=Microbulbifer sp. TYP-18 TaxID=3230024 RepID=UPI0034C5DE8C